MIKKVSVTAIFMLILAGYVLSAAGLKQERQKFISDRYVEYTIPSELLAPLSLEFKGLTSDFLLLKFMAFIGVRNSQVDNFDSNEWASIEHTLDTITDLDPYYWDAYLFAQVFLTWDEKNYSAANALLLKARKYIPDNYRIPYYMGLNYYNFANDPANGAKYMMEASKIPGSPYYLANLAARLAAYSSDHQRGIIFLSEMLKQTTSPEIAEQYKLRIQVLERMNQLEQLIDMFRLRFNRLPAILTELEEAGFLKAIPEDPYGGTFYIKENGDVYTTSNLLKK